MKTFTIFSRWAGALLLATTFLARIASAAEQPAITNVQIKTTNIVVTISVPKGITKLTLESRPNIGSGAWEPRKVSRLDGTGGSVTFTLPASELLEVLRVRGDATEVLPAKLYQGTNQFNPAPGSGGNVVNFGGAVDSRGTVPTAAGTGAGTAAPRDVVESDIWKVDGGTLYFFNQYRGLQVVDITNPDAPSINATYRVQASGEQMYLLKHTNVVLIAQDYCMYSYSGSSSRIQIVDVAGGKQATPMASVPIDGYITESRLVGTALYVASQAYRKITRPPDPKDGTTYDQYEWGTMLTSIDLSNAANPQVRGTNWISGYGSAVSATDQYFFVVLQPAGSFYNSKISIFDIAAPDGSVKALSELRTAGRVADKFKLNWNQNILAVVSESIDTNLVTFLETFDLNNASKPFKLGQVELGRRERLRATRFDGNRVYVVTFFQIDPLFIVDFSNPAKPAVTGMLEVPGFSTYLQTYGNRLVAMGVETNRATVSIFNVADATHPTLLSRVRLGDTWSYSEANWDEKAFTFLPDAGLILVPYYGASGNSYVQQVQIIDFNPDALTLRGSIKHDFQPRRSTLSGNRLISLSGRDLLSVDATDRDNPKITSDLKLSWPVNNVVVNGGHLVQVSVSDTGNSEASLIISSATAPDVALSSIPLGKLPVAGVTSKDQRLYIHQLQAAYYEYKWDEKNPTNAPTIATNLGTAALRVFDLSKLPVLSEIASATNVVLSSYIYRTAPLWVRDDLLVWSDNGYSYGPWYYAYDMKPVSIGILSGGISGRFAPWYRGSSGWFAAYTVMPNAVAFASELSMTNQNNGWRDSQSYTSGGLIFTSHSQSELIPIKPAGTNTTDLPYDGQWITHEFLDVIDYASASNPLVRRPVSIPTTLAGASHNGALVYTRGWHYRTNDWSTIGNEWLDVLAYDGVSASMVDSKELATTWPHPILIANEQIYLATASTTNNPAVLGSYAVDAGLGKIVLLQKQPLKLSLDNLVANPSGVLGSYGSEVFSFDRNTLAPQYHGVFNSCYGFDLTQADGNPTAGYWAPLGSYGVGSTLSLP